MTTRVEADKAVHVYRETQPVIDANKELVAANKAAKETVVSYMIAKDLKRFRGCELTTVEYEGLDLAKVRHYLGAKVRLCKIERFRHHLKIIKRATISRL